MEMAARALAMIIMVVAVVAAIYLILREIHGLSSARSQAREDGARLHREWAKLAEAQRLSIEHERGTTGPAKVRHLRPVDPPEED